MKRYIPISIMIAISVGIYLYLNLERSFDSNAWKSNSFRDNMVKNLIIHLNSQEFSHSEVINLLGSPDGSNGPEMIEYFIESKAIVGLRSDWLSIHFEDDKLVDAKIVEID